MTTSIRCLSNVCVLLRMNGWGGRTSGYREGRPSEWNESDASEMMSDVSRACTRARGEKSEKNDLSSLIYYVATLLPTPTSCYRCLLSMSMSMPMSSLGVI